MLKQAKIQCSRKTISKTEHVWQGIVTAGDESKITTVVKKDAHEFLVYSDKETYPVNSDWQSCTCHGRRNGYLCKHLRLVASLEKTGDLI